MALYCFHLIQINVISYRIDIEVFMRYFYFTAEVPPLLQTKQLEIA